VTQAASAVLSSTGTTASLSVTASDPNQGATITKYTWSVSGPSGVTFSSSNGTSTGNSATATFTQTGTYTFTVTITDSLGLNSTSTAAALVVGQVLTSITVSPANSVVKDGLTKQFAASAFDQFGNAMVTQPSFTWSLAAGAGGTINASTGVYTAPAVGFGTDTVQATSSGVTGTTTVTHAQPPTVTQAASAVLSSKGTTASLSVSASDPNPGGSITKYTWSVSGPTGVTFGSSNGTSTGNNTTATFTQTGTYTFTVTITDALGLTSTSTVKLIVGQVLTKITVSPSTASVRDGTTKQFAASALDQFNKAMNVPISWKIVSGLGSISSTGLYTAPSRGTGTVTIEAFDGSVFGTATITLRRR
jgi:plastocyanin